MALGVKALEAGWVVESSQWALARIEVQRAVEMETELTWRRTPVRTGEASSLLTLRAAPKPREWRWAIRESVAMRVMRPGALAYGVWWRDDGGSWRGQGGVVVSSRLGIKRVSATELEAYVRGGEA